MRPARLLVLAPLAAVLVLPLALGAAATPSGGPGLPVHDDIPPVALAAYISGALHAADRDPTCRPPWSLLAGIGKVETDHGRFGGSGLTPDGDARPPILGVLLDGSLPGTRAIADTDDGQLDGSTTYDRALGPMQFLPGTWAVHGVDVDLDGDADPQNVVDAAGAAAIHLCAGAPADIGTDAGRRGAVLAYNRSTDYVESVLAWADAYAAEATYPIGGGAGPIACPVAPPVHFIDSWHFPRSGNRLHKGQDLFAVEGQPLVALADGMVTDVRTGAGLGGNVVWLHADDGHHWYYAHLRSFAPGLAVGDRVSRGQVIGTVGRTGNAATTPPHLHIQWRPSGRHGADENPYPLLSAACPGHAETRRDR